MSRVPHSNDAGDSGAMPTMKPALKTGNSRMGSGELDSTGEPKHRLHPQRESLKTPFSGELVPGTRSSMYRTRWKGELVNLPRNNDFLEPPQAQPNHVIELLSHSASRVLQRRNNSLNESQLGYDYVGSDDSQSNENELVEVILDVGEDGVTLRRVDSGSRLSASQRLRNLSTELRQLSRNRPRMLSARFREKLRRGHDQQDDSFSESEGSGALDRSHVELDEHRIHLQRSTSKPLEGLKIINKLTATADQQRLWEGVKARFHTLKNEEGLLKKSDFANCIDMANSKEFAGELYDALSRRAGRKSVDVLTEEDLYEYWMRISDQSFDSRMQIFVDLCDKNSDGRISEVAVKELLGLSAAANKLNKLQEQAEEYAALIMEELDHDRNGFIEVWQLEALLKDPVGGFNGDTYVQYTGQGSIPQGQMHVLERAGHAAKHFFHDNWKKIWVIVLWLLCLAGLFAWKFKQYEKHSAFLVMRYCLPVAKGAAETLKLNMAIILLPMCRITLTYLRSTFLNKVICFDDNVNFHMLVASAIAVGVLIHAGVHLSCDFPRIVHANHDLFERSVGADLQSRPDYWWFLSSKEGLTGIFMVILMAIAYTFATKWLRESLVKPPRPFHKLHGFNVFWYSHHLFSVVYILLIIHGTLLIFTQQWWKKTVWMYLAIPLLLYTGERVLRAVRAGKYHVDVVKAAIYPGNVLSLHFTKPPEFTYKSGMYMYVNCPVISDFEWHPFSITSAPGDPYLSVHIQTLGDWTQELRTIFQRAAGGKKRLQLHNNWGLSGELVQDVQFPRIRIEGPYGALAQDYRKYDILLLVGLGIGATPFISILKDMLINMRNEAIESGKGNLFATPSASAANLERKTGTASAYFYWVTREQGSFDWFRGVMREVEDSDQQHLIEMHNYLTSVYKEGDARSAFITMLQTLHHAKNGVDFVSGTRARTHFAQPNWKKVFSNLAATHKGKRVGVFYCGPAVLAKELSQLSNCPRSTPGNQLPSSTSIRSILSMSQRMHIDYFVMVGILLVREYLLISNLIIK